MHSTTSPHKNQALPIAVREVEGRGAGLVAERPCDRGAHVVVFSLEVGQPLGLVGTVHGGARLAGESPVVHGMPATKLLDLVVVEAFEPVVGHRLEQAEASFAGAASDPADHRRIHQPGHEVEDLGGVLGGRGDRLDGRKIEIPGKDGEPVEQMLLSFAEQVVAPVNGGPQRAVTGIVGQPVTGEHVESMSQAFEELGGVEHGGAGGRELDRERDAVDAPADLGHGDEADVVDRWSGSFVGAVGEQSHRREQPQLGGRRSRRWELERLDRLAELPGDMKGNP